MDTYDIPYAREHLDEFVARASRGESVTIVDPAHGTMKLVPEVMPGKRGKILFGLMPNLPDVSAERFITPLTDEEMHELFGDAFD